MELIVKRETVWAASMEDKPGSLAKKLCVLAEAGADLDFIIARRAPDKPGTGVVFVTPLRGDAEIDAASQIGFNVTNRLHSLRVEGENQEGIAAKLTAKLGDAGVNLRGLSGAVIGTRFVLHLGLDTEADVERVIRILKEA